MTKKRLLTRFIHIDVPGLILLGSKSVQIVTGILSFSVLPRLLDGEVYGLASLVATIAVYLQFFDFGFGTALRNKLCEMKAGSSLNPADLYYSITFFLFVLTLCILGLLGFMGGFGDIVKFLLASQTSQQEYVYVVKIAIILMLISVPLNMGSKLLYTYHKYKLIFVIESLGSCTSLGALGLLYFFPEFFGRERYVLAVSMLSLVHALLSSALVIYHLDWKLEVSSFFSKMWVAIGFLWKKARSYSFSQICYLVVFYADQLILVRVADLSTVGDYKILMTLYQIGVTLIQSYMSTSWTVTTEHFQASRIDRIYEVIQRNTLISFGISLLALIGGVVVFKPLVAFMTGRQLFFSPYMAALLAMWVFLSLFPYTYLNVLNGINDVFDVSILYIVQAVVKVGACIYLGRIYGQAGILSGSCLTFLVGSIALPLIVRRKLAHHAKRHFSIGSC